jgi:hypothetical protein
MQPYLQTHNYIVQKTLQFLPCNPTSKHIITLHISLSEIKHYTKKRKINRANQCFHFGLFFFISESMICIPFSIKCTILLPFPFSFATVDDFTAGVARFLPYTFPPHPSFGKVNPNWWFGIYWNFQSACSCLAMLIP